MPRTIRDLFDEVAIWPIGRAKPVQNVTYPLNYIDIPMLVAATDV